MDTSPEYVKMCHRAIELRWYKDLEDRERDFYAIVPDSVEGNVWLPRQDQLQEMVEPKPSPRLFAEFMTFLGYDGEHFSGGYPITRPPDFSSMEQLWLAFVMKEKYGKTWNGEEWVNV